MQCVEHGDDTFGVAPLVPPQLSLLGPLASTSTEKYPLVRKILSSPPTGVSLLLSSWVPQGFDRFVFAPEDPFD